MSDYQPDTRFLEQAANLALTNIINRLDRERDFQPYFRLDLASDPPEAKHDSWDFCDMSGRYVDALILIRQMTGNQEGKEEEARLREFLLKRCKEDGLFYNEEGPESEYAVDVFCQGRVLLGLVSWYLQTGESLIEQKIEGMIRGLDRIAYQGDGYCWYPKDRWVNGEWIGGGIWEGRYPGYGFNQLVGLMRYYEASGSKAALAFAEKMVRYYVYMHDQVKPDGSYTGHTHSGGVLPTVAGILRYALATDNEEIAHWARRVFEYTQGVTSNFGFVPDAVGFGPDYIFANICETCSITDHFHLAIKLTEAGMGSYWDDIERYTRNQLLENQYRMLDPTIPEEVWNRSKTGVGKMFIGAFESWASPNGLLFEPAMADGCCVGAGPRACFLVWDRIIQKKPDGLYVNLLFSRDSEWADVIGYEPYQGLVKVKPKEDADVFIRIPSWAVSPKVRLNGTEIPLTTRGEYARVKDAKAGDTVELVYSQKVFEEEQTVAFNKFRLRWKGGTVTSIDPPGKRYPIYQRQYFEADKAPEASKIYTPGELKVRW